MRVYWSQLVAHTKECVVGRLGANALKLYTIGFTKKSAEDFFELLSASGAVRLVDVRLKNVSQLAGFAKRGRPRIPGRQALRDGVRASAAASANR